MEAQIIGDPGYQRIERRITGEAEDVIDVVVLVRPVHRLDAAVMAVAAPHDAGGRPMPSQMLRHVLDDGPHLRALRGARERAEPPHFNAMRPTLVARATCGDQSRPWCKRPIVADVGAARMASGSARMKATADEVIE